MSYYNPRISSLGSVSVNVLWFLFRPVCGKEFMWAKITKKGGGRGDSDIKRDVISSTVTNPIKLPVCKIALELRSPAKHLAKFYGWCSRPLKPV